MGQKSSTGPMFESTTVFAKMGYSMESDPTLQLTGALARVSGLKANVSNHWAQPTIYQDVLLLKRVVL